MSLLKENSRILRSQIRSAFTRLATGGDWAMGLPDLVRRNLMWFWCDGLFASASDNIIGTYLVIYLLSLGATQGQIGLMSSFSSLSAAAMLLPGAMLVERLGKRRNLALFGGFWSRVMLLILAVLPFIIKAPWLIVIAIVLSVSRDAMGNLAYPAWISLTGDIIPIEGRGRFFSSRNIIMGISGMLVTLLAGLLISKTVQPTGYQIALFVAFVFGAFSVFSFAHISEKTQPLVTPKVAESWNLRAVVSELANHREFLFFALTSALWNFSLNIAGPFFTVHLVQNLHADAAMVGLTSIASMLAGLLAQRKMGQLNDRWGARRLTMISGLLIPVAPILWVFATAAWHVIPINLISGILWGGYNLASFNYLLMITPASRRARFSALFQITVTISLAIGAALGSLVVTQWGINAVFIMSGIGRLVAAILFARLMTRKIPAPAEFAAAN